jgi:hypothetical protein
MPSDLQNLQTTKSNYIQLLTTESSYMLAHGPKPAYTIDGEQYDWDGFRRELNARIKELNDLIQIESGPFEVRTQGIS